MGFRVQIRQLFIHPVHSYSQQHILLMHKSPATMWPENGTNGNCIPTGTLRQDAQKEREKKRVKEWQILKRELVKWCAEIQNFYGAWSTLTRLQKMSCFIYHVFYRCDKMHIMTEMTDGHDLELITQILSKFVSLLNYNCTTYLTL